MFDKSSKISILSEAKMNNDKCHRGALTTVCKGGLTHKFYYVSHPDSYLPNESYESLPIWSFRITEKPDDALDAGFQFDVVDEGLRLRVEHMVNNSDERYSAKGIPEECIRTVSKLFEKNVVSSSEWTEEVSASTGFTHRLESRAPNATKVWERLRESGEATFDEKERRFSFVPKVDQTV